MIERGVRVGALESDVLLSYSKKFIFLANVKTASTSIENALGRHAEIAINRTDLGKHHTLDQVAKRYAWLFRQEPLENFFVFGVVRDPVERLCSIYNFHIDNVTAVTTRGLSFEEFLDDWLKNSWQTRPQPRIFMLNGESRVDAVIRFDRLAEEVPAVARHLGLARDLKVPHVLKSAGHMTPDALDPALRRRIVEHYAEEIAFLDAFGGRMRVEGEWRPIVEAAPPAPPPPPAPAQPARGGLDRLRALVFGERR